VQWAIDEAQAWPATTPQGESYTYWLRIAAACAARPGRKPRMEQIDLFTEMPRAGEYPIPAGATPTSCRSCGASIVWTRTEADKPIPLALATARDCGGQRVATTHFADCEHSREWRRKE
jgi:hypothetical protein